MMGSTMEYIKDLRNDPDYLNYIAVGEALRILSAGLRHFTSLTAEELQERLVNKLAGECNCLVTPGVKPCRHTCKWARALEKMHANKKKKFVRFYQSDNTVWHDPNGYWELAKVFMNDLGGKWNDVKSPEDTDLTGLLNFLIFYKQSKVQQHLLISVRDLRNDLAHTKSYKISASEKQAAFDSIDRLMNDFELLSCKEVQDCRQGIEEVKNGDVSFIQERDVLVLKEITRHQEFEKERMAENKREKLMGMIEMILATSNTNNHYNDDSSENAKHFGIKIIEIVAFLIKMLKDCCYRKRLTFLILFMILLSSASDNSVFVVESGCYRPIKLSPTGFNEFDFTTHLSNNRENFFGRNWFFRDLDDIFLSNSAPQGVLIIGDPGSGKSALMSQLICSPFSSLAIYDNIIGYHVCDYSEKGKQNGARFVRNLVGQIASNFPEYKSIILSKQPIQAELKHCYEDPIACFYTTIIGPLQHLENQPDVFKYIVIDALDECVGDTSAILDIIHYKVSYFPWWLKIIISSRNSTDVTSKVPRAIKRISLNPENDQNIEDIRSYILRYLRGRTSFINKVFNAISPSKSTHEQFQHAEGNFLFVKTMLQNNDGTINFNSLPNSLHDIYDQIFQRYFKKEEVESCEIFFEVLLASGSMVKEEFFGVLKRQYQGKRVQDLVSHFSSLLHFGQDDTVSIYHQSFAEWLINGTNYGGRGFSILKNRGHEYISNFLLDRVMSNPNITFNELSRLCMHVLKAGGPNDEHKKQLKFLNITNIRNQENDKCILHELAGTENGFRLLEIFIKTFPSIDIFDLDGKTPAFYAASEGFVENLKPFLVKGTCANCILNDISALDEARTFVQMKGYEELSTMHIATYHGHIKVIDTVLKHNASLIEFDKYVPTLLQLAAERGHLDLVRLLHNYSAKADTLSLHHAAARNHFDVVNYLLEFASVKDECLPNSVQDKRSFYQLHEMFCETALHAAVSKRHLNITKLLLQYDNLALNCKHYSGKTPLMDAIERNDTEMALLLLENGANVEEKCGKEMSPSLLRPKTTNSRYFFGKKFLYTFYREQKSCPCGNKALHLSAKYGLWHMAKLLLNWNATMTDKNCIGETVWKIANVSHNQDFIYHVNRMLLHLDETPTSATQLKRTTFKKLLRKFFVRTKPYQSSFQCDSTFEGMSPLHIAALMGVDMLKRVYKKAQEIAPSIPMNCTNKHWITPRYLAYFYDNIHALTDKSSPKQTTHNNNEYKKTMLQYPDREAEFHMIYNYFFYSPSPESNVLAYRSLPRLPNYEPTNCPGFYDLLPESQFLRPKPYCPHVKERDEKYRDPANADLQKVQYCEENQPHFCFCIDELELRMMIERYAIDCFCPLFMWELQNWFTRLPKHNRRVNQFIAERMGWKDFPNGVGDYIKRWPVYFLYKKIKNEYESYKYLEILNVGYKIADMDEYD